MWDFTLILYLEISKVSQKLRKSQPCSIKIIKNTILDTRYLSINSVNI